MVKAEGFYYLLRKDGSPRDILLPLVGPELDCKANLTMRDKGIRYLAFQILYTFFSELLKKKKNPRDKTNTKFIYFSFPIPIFSYLNK